MKMTMTRKEWRRSCLCQAIELTLNQLNRVYTGHNLACFQATHRGSVEYALGQEPLSSVGGDVDADSGVYCIGLGS